MPDVSWTLHTRRRGDVTADALTTDWPQRGRGETARVRLWFDTSSHDSEELYVGRGSSETIAAGTTVTTDIVYVDGTLTVDGTLNAGEVRVDDGTLTVSDTGALNVADTNRSVASMQEYGYWPAAPTTNIDIDAVPTYRERLPPSASVTSLVIGFEPSDSIQDRGKRGFWGIVTGVDDATNSPLTNYQLEFSVFVLADYRDYADHQAVETTFEA